MCKILHIETAIDVCSVVVADNGKVLSVKESYEPRVHASMTAVFVKEALEEAGLIFKDLDAIAVSKGPGSYTGLRIGVATAKGLCFTLDKPLIAVDTLKAMSAMYLYSHPELSPLEYLVPLIDARRMEVYGCVLDQRLNYIEETKAEILTENSFMVRNEIPRIVFGDGALKTTILFKNHHKVKIDNFFKHSARGLVTLSLELYKCGKFENVANFEPYYLKEFLDNTPKTNSF